MKKLKIFESDTVNDFKAIAKAKLEKLSVPDLKQQAIELSTKLDNSSSMVLESILDVLESKMDESEFVAFCDSL